MGDYLVKGGARGRTWLPVLAFGVLYYLFELLTFEIRLEGSVMGAFWTLGALLLAVLLLTPKKQWPAYLGATAVAHLLAYVGDTRFEWKTALPSLPVYLLVISLLARGIERFGGLPFFTTVRGMAVFLLVALSALPATLMALAVLIVIPIGWQGDEHFMLQTTYLSVALGTALATPPLVQIGLRWRHWLRIPWRSWAEAALLALGLIAAVYWALPRAAQIGPAAALLYVPLPWLLWAALRFGVSGVSAALLGLTMVSMWTTLHIRSPFAGDTPGEQVFALQLFLLVASVPLLSLAAVVEERWSLALGLAASERQARHQLEELWANYRTAPIGLASLDAERRFVRINDHFAAISGRGATDHLGRTIRIVLPRLSESLDPLIQRALDNGAHVLDVEVEDAGSQQHGVPRTWLTNIHPAKDEQGNVHGVNLVVQDITERKRGEQTLRRIAAGVSAATGATFFNQLVKHLSTALEADYAVVARLIGPQLRHVQTVAVSVDGRLSDDFDYPLAGTPCETAIAGGICAYPSNVRDMFPGHPLLERLAAESYLGVPLRDSSGRPTGLLAVLNRKPMANVEVASTTIQIFAARAAAELERKQAEDENRSLLQVLGLRVKELTALHRASRLFQDNTQPIAEWLQQLVDLLPSAWQYPEITGARVHLGELQYCTANFVPTLWLQRAEFSVQEAVPGAIEIVYLEERPTAHEGPFLADERSLIDSLAEMLRTGIGRRLAQDGLTHSEERYRGVVETQTELVCRYLSDTTLTFVNEAFCRFYGRPREELIGRPFLELLPPAERAPALEHVGHVASVSDAQTWEHSVLLPKGLRRQEWVDHAIRSPDGTLVEFQGIGRDITDRWRAEEALRKNEAALQASYRRIQELAGRLIDAQEAERSRIARELHDDVNQQVAALSIGLSLLKDRLISDPSGGFQALTRLQQLAASLADKVRYLSHELHSGVLQHAGLVAALRAYCEEISDQNGLDVAFKVEGEDFTEIPSDVELCLYRVGQQALHNVVRHSSASHAEVVLTRMPAGVELAVIDDGRGFDLIRARAQGGIGLISLEERTRLVHGSLTIDTRPFQGTALRVVVPLEREASQTVQ